MRALLRQPGFAGYWASRIVAITAGQMLLVALGWQVYDLTGSAWDLGLVGLAQFLPGLLLALPAGHIVDKYPRRAVLALAMVVQAGVALALAIASQHHALSRDGVLLLSLLLGAARAFQMPASGALLPQLLPPALLPRALALSSSAMQGAIVAGPALGGMVYAAGSTCSGMAYAAGSTSSGVVYAAGPAAVYSLAAAGYALALGGLVGLRPRPFVRSKEPASWSTVLAGLHFIWARPVLLGAVLLDLFAVLLGGATALLPIFARDILHTGPDGLGLLRAAPAFGALAMSLLLARWPIQRRSGTWLLGSVALFGLTMVVFGLSTTFWLSLLALGLSGMADMVSVTVRHSLLQLETPDAMRGRVGAVNSVFIGASNELGEFESGATAAWWGPVASVVAGGVGTMLVVALWLRLFTPLAQRDHLVPPA